jgi:hypothetical protein
VGKAVKTAEAWCRGEASAPDVRRVADAAGPASAVCYVAYYADYLNSVSVAHYYKNYVDPYAAIRHDAAVARVYADYAAAAVARVYADYAAVSSGAETCYSEEELQRLCAYAIRERIPHA